MAFKLERFAEKYKLALESAEEQKPAAGLNGFELEFNLLDEHFRPLLTVGSGPARQSFVDYLRNTRNDLETPAREEAPGIGDVLDGLVQSGAMLSRMSGSGATCFGLFANKSDADKAAASIEKANPKWWVRSANVA